MTTPCGPRRTHSNSQATTAPSAVASTRKSSTGSSVAQRVAGRPATYAVVPSRVQA